MVFFEELGSLLVSLNWEFYKGDPPYGFTYSFDGIYATVFIFVMVFAGLYFLGLVSKAFYELRVLRERVRGKRADLETIQRGIEAETEALRKIKNDISESEKSKLSMELEKTPTSSVPSMHEERSRLAHWRMVEKKFGGD